MINSTRSAWRSHAALLLALAFLFPGTPQAQQLYRWVDKDGRVTYSHQPPPVGAAASVQQKNLGSTAPGTPVLPYAVQLAIKNFPVTLYTAAECTTACGDARDSLQKRGIPFKEVVVSDVAGVEALRKLTGKNQVPALQVGPQTYSGFEPATWKSALDTAGYPASIAAQPVKPAPAPVEQAPAAVRLFASADCGLPCQSARDLLKSRGIAFQEVSLQSEASISELKRIAGDSNVVPVLVIGSTSLRGFDPQQYQAALDAAGYPAPQPAN